MTWTATFTFAKRQFDDDFHRLDAQIAEAARAIPGYLGEEAWENPATGLVANVYHWESLEALQQLMQHPVHRQAKGRQAEWLAGYQVVISQVLRVQGDGRLQGLPLTPREAPRGT
ncbi:antibiotic biosynthesis monooxygenase family protein [Leptothrix sp. BB-4]